jgi:ABC-type sugar transport system ATPase subunit
MTIDIDIIAEAGGFKLNARFRAAGIINVTGENGSGKTFLLRCIAGLASCQGSRVIVNGRDVSFYPPERRSIVYASQNSYFMSMTSDRHIVYGIDTTRFDRSAVSEVTEGLMIPLGKRMSQLSQGQRMRVAIATALLSGKEVLLLDEVISNLSDGRDVMSFLREFSKKNGLDLMIVSHGYSVPEADLLVRMNMGTATLEPP